MVLTILVCIKYFSIRLSKDHPSNEIISISYFDKRVYDDVGKIVHNDAKESIIHTCL